MFDAVMKQWAIVNPDADPDPDMLDKIWSQTRTRNGLSPDPDTDSYLLDKIRTRTKHWKTPGSGAE